MGNRSENKGEVTPLGSLFPAEEAQKASKLVQDAILNRRIEIDQLNSFITDNSNLTKLVRKLPDEISHEIMVPFGSAAFFPGQLIHTNEFMVFLGDGYYAERTSTQTVEILKRRGKSLESQVEALKASLLDLEAEAKFFDLTASDAREGIVEIIEDYTEEQEGVVEIRENYTEELRNESVAEEEHARIMARFDELEKEELEDEDDAYGSDQYSKAVLHFPTPQNQNIESMEPVQKSRSRELPNFSDAKVEKSSVSAGGFDGGKAFTGSVIERSHGLMPSNQPVNRDITDQPSKPVSRFKMMKSNRA